MTEQDAVSIDELLRLSEAGTIRVLDILLLQKRDDGTVDALEIDEAPELDDLRALEVGLAAILAAADVVHLAPRWPRAPSPAADQPCGYRSPADSRLPFDYSAGKSLDPRRTMTECAATLTEPPADSGSPGAGGVAVSPEVTSRESMRQAQRVAGSDAGIAMVSGSRQAFTQMSRSSSSRGLPSGAGSGAS
jgi:hypothetical protein